jgi:hypothetical protein
MTILRQICLLYFIVETTEKEPIGPNRYPVRKVMNFFDIPEDVVIAYFDQFE